MLLLFLLRLSHVLTGAVKQFGPDYVKYYYHLQVTPVHYLSAACSAYSTLSQLKAVLLALKLISHSPRFI